jgi:dTDP-4-amino-4,6-dideoxygalactose transaminase
MTDIQAAMGLAQLQKLPALQRRRAQLAGRYDKALTGLPLRRPTSPPGMQHSWHLYSIVLELEELSGSRDDVIEDLRLANIGASVHFIPIYRHTYYREQFRWRSEDFPGCEEFYAGQISLPLYPSMSLSDVDDVAEALSESLRRRQR